MIDVSIIVPIFNKERFLKDCLDSLINQTYKNIEIICINDGSTDHSLDILRIKMTGLLLYHRKIRVPEMPEILV